ncbi:MAG TPA: SRPBCC family protein [Ktedonobacterales bacterium]
MQVIVATIIIQRPVEDVFAFVTDARNNVLWQSAGGLRSVRQEPDGPVGVGTIITEVRQFMDHLGESVSEVTEYEPSRKYTRSEIPGAMSDSPITRGEFLFEPVEQGTRWTARFVVQASNLFAMNEPVLAAILQEGMESSLAEAKSLLERSVIDHTLR